MRAKAILAIVALAVGLGLIMQARLVDRHGRMARFEQAIEMPVELVTADDAEWELARIRDLTSQVRFEYEGGNYFIHNSSDRMVTASFAGIAIKNTVRGHRLSDEIMPGDSHAGRIDLPDAEIIYVRYEFK